MPADRRTFTANKPVKTERTHEENQERAYIAASRRSDRSLEARIESARRASEIHKKRTGRALRVTEQDVVNEEMYEEEDDDLPTQYQRLNAHLHTTSIMFNKKLHDYIATQQGVRNMFLSHYQNPPYQPYGGQAGMSASFSPQMGWVNPAMMSPQTFNPSTQGMSQPSPTQPFSPHGFQQPQQQSRPAPYHIPQRSPSHQRSASIASIPTPQPVLNFDSSMQANNAALSDATRRMSLPPHVLEQSAQGAVEGQSRPPLSRSSTSQSVQQQQSSPQGLTNISKTPSDQGTPRIQSECSTPGAQSFNPMNYAMSSQVLNMNPLSMSLPPESQQLVGSVLDPNDPRTAIFMAGSDNLPQPFAPTYTYNPNVSPKSSRTGDVHPISATVSKVGNAGVTQTLGLGETIKLETSLDDDLSSAPHSATTDLYSPSPLFTPGAYDCHNFFDFQSAGYAQALDDPSNSNDQPIDHFVNWD